MFFRHVRGLLSSAPTTLATHRTPQDRARRASRSAKEGGHALPPRPPARAVRGAGTSLHISTMRPACGEPPRAPPPPSGRLPPFSLFPRHSLLLIDRCPHCL